MLQFPPSHPDDTQPRLSATQPIQRKSPLLPQWVLLMLIAATLLTLVATFSLMGRTTPIALAPTNVIKQVVLVVNGQRTDYQTTQDTIGAFLAEQGIQVATEDALSDTPDTPLKAETIITISRARDVSLSIDGVETTVRTPFSLPADILKQQNVTLREIDRVWLDGTVAHPADVPLWQIPVNVIIIQHALSVTIVDEGRETTLNTTAKTIGDVLFEADVTLYLTDEVVPDVTDSVTDNQRIVITRAQPIQIQVDGTTLETRVQGGTVIDALAEVGVALVGLDRVIPAENTPVEPGMTIQIVRVTEQTLSTEATIDFETVYQPDNSLALDTQATLQNGQVGKLQIDLRVRYENGVEVSRAESGRTVIQEPQNQIIGYGTQIVLNTVTTADGTFEYWRKLRVYATSYKPESVNGNTTTAIGETLRKGMVGANPQIIPYRTPIYVEGYGTGIIADTGGARSSPYWIDLGYSDEDYVSWHGYVDIYLLTPVPSNIPYLLPTWTPLRGTSGY